MKMKRNKSIKWLSAVLLSLAMSGCSLFDRDDHLSVSEDQLYGCWVKENSEEYWRYNENGTGVTWDEADDISEEESNLSFTWTVREDELTHIFRGEMDNQAVPKVYTIKAINNNTMRWEDDYGISYKLNKVDR